MNFVAHAVVAAAEGDRGPERPSERETWPYAFGAMVPDLRAFASGQQITPPDADRGLELDAGALATAIANVAPTIANELDAVLVSLSAGPEDDREHE